MIAVISDSHVPRRADGIPQRFIEVLEESEQAVHCGDFAEEQVKEKLEQSCDLVAVKGNCDFFDLPNSETFEKNGLKFGVYHGTGITPRGHRPTLVKICDDLEVDILLHGHTHKQEAVKEDGKILLNPGSCTGVSGGTARASAPQMMKIHLEEDELIVDLIKLQEGEMISERKSFDT